MKAIFDESSKYDDRLSELYEPKTEEDKKKAQAELDHAKAQMRLNRKRRRAQYASPSRSKPYARQRTAAAFRKLASIARGKRKIMALIQRGLDHNRRVVVVRKDPVAKAVQKAVADE